MLWIGYRGVNMDCKEKTTLKLSSNIISKEIGYKKLGLYIPFDLKPTEYKYPGLREYLTDRQKNQLDKQYFYAKEIIDDELRYPEKEENIEKCRTCQYKDICF